MKVSRSTFDEVMVPCYVPQDMVLKSGKGCYVFDTANNKYIDLSAGIAVSSLGHANAKVIKAIKKQSKRLLHVSNIFVNDKTLILAKKLVSITDFEKVFFANSGAEANEAALKLARRVAYDTYGEQKNEIISFNQSFHGRTLFSVSVGGQKKYSSGFGPIPDGITHLPFNDLHTLQEHISDKTCAVILEPIQGEGGILQADLDFIKGVRELCDKHNALLIFDEVQTGIGRTGTFFAYEQLGVKPDIVTLAKGIAAGLPMGAMLTFDKYAKHFTPGTHGSTFGGNPLASAVASVVVDTVNDKSFLDNVKKSGEYLQKELQRLADKYGVFKQIRGHGLLIGAQLSDEYASQSSVLQKHCTEHHLLVLVAGPNVLRFAPPLIINQKILKEAIKHLEKAIKAFIKKSKEQSE